jgi:hypothetical protein
MIKKALIGIAFFAGLGLTSTASYAVVISSGVSNPYNFSWSHTVVGSDSLQHTLTGFGSLTVAGFNSNSLTINVSLTNTSLLGGIGGERLTAFGFGIDPDATSVSFVDTADGGMINAALGQNFPGFQGIDVCARGGSTCAGGGNGGIRGAGGSDAFQIILGGTWGSSVNIDPLALKYQTGYGSFEFSPPGNPPGSVPAPGPLAFFLIGLVGIGARQRVAAMRSTS